MIYLRFIFFILIFIITGCHENSIQSEGENSSWVFVANEGEFSFSGPTNTGTITLINSFGDVIETDPLGDIVHALGVYNNKLIVSVNNSQKILLFDITSEGISNEIGIPTGGLSPREINIIDNRAYIAVWDPDFNIYESEPGNIKILNLDSNEFEETTIQVGIMPEGMLFDSNLLWVANSGESTVSKIDINTNLVVETLEVGRGPQNLTMYNNEVYISRTFYDSEYDENGFWLNTVTTHGSSKINNDEITINNYGSGVVCGGSVLNYDNNVYRSYDGGIFPLEENLDINESGRIGDYNQDKVYHVEAINDNVWFGIRSLNNEPGEIRIVDSNNFELAVYPAGINPGDFTIWSK